VPVAHCCRVHACHVHVACAVRRLRARWKRVVIWHKELCLSSFLRACVVLSLEAQMSSPTSTSSSPLTDNAQLRLPQMSEPTQPAAGTEAGERPALPPGVLFTCMTCRVGFAAAAAHREHFKSDWHRYNLKRKVRVHLSTHS
jgi:hypothetical protein